MPLSAGTQLGPYEIVGPLGSGGMGEVYRARDTRLGREVAVKVLPQHLSADSDIRARFEREARTVSSLNHPHICVLHDVGREGETDYLVMELVEGETLAERLSRGPLPLDQVLALGGQIADALDRAHRAGIIHRDLKPGNVMLTKSGAKLMDFGLARATGLAGPGGMSGVTIAALTQTPTMAQPLTVEGTIVGTFQYMSPEQLEGKEADARSDVWALGCVLYEMATGRRAFEGKSQASLISSIMASEPASLAQVMPMVPPALDRLIKACLNKDADQRLQTAHDARLQLQWIAEGGSQAGVPAPVAARRKSREALAWTLAGLGAVAALALGLARTRQKPPAARVTRFSVEEPEATLAVSWPRVSPDGKMLAFLANDSTGVRRVWVRPLDAIEAHPLSGADGNARPFWSPDSRFLAFILDGRLRKVPVGGGPAVTISDVPGGYDGSWGKGDVILFDGGQTDSIRMVAASGGLPKPATTFDRSVGENQHAWPFFLPDGKHFLFTARRAGQSASFIRLGTIGSMESKVIGQTDGRVEFAPPGYIVFPSGGTLLAQPIDAAAGKTTGDPVPVGEDIAMGNESGDFSISMGGVMAYRSEKAAQGSSLVWVGRDGRRLAEAAPPGAYGDVALSPDDGRIAVSINSGQPPHSDIWVRDLVRGTTSRLTFDPEDDIWPVWSPDGNRIAFATNRAGDYRVMVKAANGVGAEDTLTHVPGDQGPTCWSRDGRTVVSSSFGLQAWDIYAQSPANDRPPTLFLQTPFAEREGQLSPDGRWLAYASRESGRNEIYIVPFPGPGGKWQVSTAGGTFPCWRADGGEVFYRAPDQMVMAVPVEAGATIQLGTPQPLFKTPLAEGGLGGRRWVPASDGQRFLLNVPYGQRGSTRLIVVTDWTAELKKK